MTQPGDAVGKLRRAVDAQRAQQDAVRDEAARIAREREAERPSTVEQ